MRKKEKEEVTNEGRKPSYQKYQKSKMKNKSGFHLTNLVNVYTLHMYETNERNRG